VGGMSLLRRHAQGQPVSRSEPSLMVTALLLLSPCCCTVQPLLPLPPLPLRPLVLISAGGSPIACCRI
jgi:hypothetical protein